MNNQGPVLEFDRRHLLVHYNGIKSKNQKHQIECIGGAINGTGIAETSDPSILDFCFGWSSYGSTVKLSLCTVACLFF